MSSFHVAVWGGLDAIVETLIQVGADVNLRDKVSEPLSYENVFCNYTLISFYPKET